MSDIEVVLEGLIKDLPGVNIDSIRLVMVETLLHCRAKCQSYDPPTHISPPQALSAANAMGNRFDLDYKDILLYKQKLTGRDQNRFLKFADEPIPSLPKGFSAPLPVISTQEQIVNRLKCQQRTYGETFSAWDAVQNEIQVTKPGQDSGSST